jgi:two-component sensor histidine kinase
VLIPSGPKIELETPRHEVVEDKPGEEAGQASFSEAVDEVGADSMLGYRLEQQAALSNFGMQALQLHSIDELLTSAAVVAAAGMRAKLSKIMEYRPAHNDLLVRAGVGWREGVVGTSTLGADLGSPAGYAFQTGSPVISNQLENEERFRTPGILAEHRVRRAINVLIASGSGRWGVLEVDSSSAGGFEAADLAFLQGLANFIGVALDRQLAEERLTEAIEYQKILVKEASHRVKNSLAMLSGLLRMQARGSLSSEAIKALGDASDRIIAVAKTHDRLWRDADAETTDLGLLVSDICDALQQQWAHMEFRCSVASMEFPADRAASFALLLTELATNAAKHAYGPDGGPVAVSLSRSGERRILEVRDQGVGAPLEGDALKAGLDKLGMRLIQTLTQSIDGTLTVGNEGGAVFRIEF